MYISAAPPDEMSLGATNGLAQTSASVMRAVRMAEKLLIRSLMDFSI